jgi:choline kinase
VRPQEARAITEGVIVAAGIGSRLQSLAAGAAGTAPLIKPLQMVAGRPLLRRILDRAFEAGLTRIVVVVGFQAEALTAEIRRWEPLAGTVDFAFNPDYLLSNGISLLCGARRCRGDFALLMSDHLFECRNLQSLLARGLAADKAVLAVDRKISAVFDLDDATKVCLQHDRIVEIGKRLPAYDAVDTGLFLLSRDIVAGLETLVKDKGDASISAAMHSFIAQRTMAAFDIGDGLWQDVDTPAMFSQAERLVRKGIL